MTKALTNKDLVLRYINRRNKNSLIFCYFNGEDLDKTTSSLIELLPLDLLILECLKLSLSYCSKDSVNDKIETEPNKYRSSLDIWRHVIYFNPEITIFDVMESLYENRGKLITHYCPDIKRRVFKLPRDHYFTSMNDEDCLDEYELTFYDWENINEYID